MRKMTKVIAFSLCTMLTLSVAINNKNTVYVSGATLNTEVSSGSAIDAVQAATTTPASVTVLPASDTGEITPTLPATITVTPSATPASKAAVTVKANYYIVTGYNSQTNEYTFTDSLEGTVREDNGNVVTDGIPQAYQSGIYNGGKITWVCIEYDKEKECYSVYGSYVLKVGYFILNDGEEIPVDEIKSQPYKNYYYAGEGYVIDAGQTNDIQTVLSRLVIQPKLQLKEGYTVVWYVIKHQEDTRYPWHVDGKIVAVSPTPTAVPTTAPNPTAVPTNTPYQEIVTPTAIPTVTPTVAPTAAPTVAPTSTPVPEDLNIDDNTDVPLGQPTPTPVIKNQPKGNTDAADLTMDIKDDDTAKGTPKLPQTGTANEIVIYMIGGALIMIGMILCKKKDSDNIKE